MQIALLLSLLPLCLPQGRTAPPPVTPGTPVSPTTITIDGAWENETSPAEQIILRLRLDDSLLAYVAGAPGLSTPSGSLVGSTVTLAFEGEDGGGPFDAGTFTGTFIGHRIEGSLVSSSSSMPLTLVRSTALLLEEDWLLVEEDSGEAVQAARLTDAGAFFGGSFTGLGQCDFLACGGGITDWNISGTGHTIQTSSGGSCDSLSTLLGTFDPSSAFLTGTYSTSDCWGSSAGNFMAGKEGLTDTRHMRAVLELLADFCDALETESATAIDALHSAYLHDGLTRADWETQFATWFLNYNSIEANATPTSIITIDDGEVHPYLAGPPRLGWHLLVTGVPAGGGAPETLLDYEPELFLDSLHYLGVEGGQRVFVGNGEAAPFSMNMPIAFGDGAISNYGLWPYGVHGGGHPEGHPGIDIEYAAGTSVLATTAGTISSIGPNSHFPTMMDLMLEARTGVAVQYDHMGPVDPSITVGSTVLEGQVLGDAPSGAHSAVHLALRLGVETTCPVPYFNAAGQSTFDALWDTAHYMEELVEPLACNTVDVSFPLTAVRSLISGTLPAGLEITRSDATTYDMTYTLLDAAGVAFETGTVTFNAAPTASTIDFVPSTPAGPTRLGLVDINGEDLWLDWDTTTRPTSLAGASHYRLD
ncbi:MAG TPA: peptidoglycan DD-metalloendopeptidase family protein [Planctomycetota bacterium]|jgi:hypothetical protein|nr:peptidoglycan DD-metalloendopeptidase family protein [Planctomycetota bacterium]